MLLIVCVKCKVSQDCRDYECERNLADLNAGKYDIIIIIIICCYQKALYFNDNKVESNLI